jgi:hypothetical protein
MGPRAVVDHIGKMGMQSKRHIPQRFVIGNFWSHFEGIGGPKSGVLSAGLSLSEMQNKKPKP